jgi:hypothetical protein
MAKIGKVKELKQLLGGESAGNINTMFEEMIGTKDADPEIILPKFVKTRNLIKHIYRYLLQLGSYNELKNLYLNVQLDLNQIMDFAISIKTNIIWESMVDETVNMYVKLNKQEINQFYKKIKNDWTTKELITLCGKLKRYATNFDTLDNLRDNFIGQEPGLDFRIFDFSSFDLKKVWSNTARNPMVRKFVLTTMHLLYKNLYDLYKTVSSPDVDIEQFTELLIKSIGDLEKRPGLNRCRNAFRRIRDSVGLLRNKFDDYYRDSISAENPNMMVENFILDVANNGTTDARLTREFRLIIQYMHKQGQRSGKTKDPAVQRIFKMLNQNFDLMEKKAPKTKKDDEDNKVDTEADTEVITEADTEADAEVDNEVNTECDRDDIEGSNEQETKETLEGS